jgi:hypothetical protein
LISDLNHFDVLGCRLTAARTCASGAVTCVVTSGDMINLLIAIPVVLVLIDGVHVCV